MHTAIRPNRNGFIGKFFVGLDVTSHVADVAPVVAFGEIGPDGFIGVEEPSIGVNDV